MPNDSNPLFMWIIRTRNDVHGPGPNQASLVGCQLAIVTDASGTHFQFKAPSTGSGEVTTTGSTLPALPFKFPVFTAPLAGPIPQPWYIRVTTLTGGIHGRDAEGTYSNTPPTMPSDPGAGEDDNDTWTAQAGHGTGMGDETEKDKDEEKEAAASASPKL